MIIVVSGHRRLPPLSAHARFEHYGTEQCLQQALTVQIIRPKLLKRRTGRCTDGFKYEHNTQYFTIVVRNSIATIAAKVGLPLYQIVEIGQG